MSPANQVAFFSDRATFLSFTIDCDILIAGDDLGRVWIYDVNRCLCESRQGKKLEELKETQVYIWIYVYPAYGLSVMKSILSFYHRC